jgi:F420-dependent oxidoreductase-like protein
VTIGDEAPAVPRFGVSLASVTPLADAQADLLETISELAEAAEDSGMDSFFVPDHYHQNRIGGGPRAPMLEAYALLGALAARTRTLHLGALVTPVTFRNPAALAKTVATLDVISGGRAILGIGAGWDADEHRAYGVEFPPVAVRFDHLDEALAICRAMFDGSPTTFEGDRFSVASAYNEPRPIQAHLPILVGGSGERRTLPIVAAHADISNFLVPEGRIPTDKLALLRQHCEVIGRNPATIRKTAFLPSPGSPEQLVRSVRGLFAVGFDGVVVASLDGAPATIRAWGYALRDAFD